MDEDRDLQVPRRAPPLRPLLGFSCGLVEGAVGLTLEAAETLDQLRARAGPSVGYVLTPTAAVELGRALIERGELALRPAGAQPT